MTILIDLIITTVKVVFVALLFCMPVAVLLTWADRRQGAMIQDRVGPNRAAIFMPGKLAAAAVSLPAFAIAALALGWAWFNKNEGHTHLALGIVSGQLALASVWITLFVIAGRVRVRGLLNGLDVFVHALGDPRGILGVGLLANLALLLVFAMFHGTAAVSTLSDVSVSSGPMVFAVAVVAGALYAAYNLSKQPKVALRLAGILHAAADGLKTIFKEDIVPPSADQFTHAIAPMIAFFPALVVLAVVPFADSLCFGSGSILDSLIDSTSAVCSGKLVKLQILDIDSGLLFYFALGGTGVVGAALAGWASNNKYSLLGGLRAASQMVSYEVAMGLTLIGCLMIYGTLRVDQMVAWQQAHAWGIFTQPLAFVLFFTAAVAEAKRVPFDLPEGESEIVAGYFTEYSGMKFAMFFFSEYVAIVTSSALMVSLFLGGWHVPFLQHEGIRIAINGVVYWQLPVPQLVVVLLSLVSFSLKTLLLCWLQLLIRWTVPRFRYDQLMRLGWRILLPISLGNILVTGTVMRLLSLGGESTAAVLQTIGDVTQVIVAAAGLWAVVALVLELLKPAKHKKTIFSSAARFADQMGGTRTRRMGA